MPFTVALDGAPTLSSWGYASVASKVTRKEGITATKNSINATLRVYSRIGRKEKSMFL
jgi:hypothetical protein